MTRPLQKKKNKSSLPRIRQKPKSKRINIKSNPIVAANWYIKKPLIFPSSFTPFPPTLSLYKTHPHIKNPKFPFKKTL